MDTNGLKKFAQSARNMLIDQVTSKLDVVLAEGAAARREHPRAIKDLEAAIHKGGKWQVIEQVAYTWFNRFTALRFMDANGYTNPRIVSPAEGATRPEILAEAMAGNLPEGAPAGIAALIDGRTPSGDPHAEAYRQLLVHACNQWHASMPFMFEQIDDYTELLMPQDLLSQTSIIADLREVMTEEACRDVEIIGWLYQFYISEKKDQVFAALKKNVKIAAENIPAATQLFTPHWIVRYLVESSLGRLWLLNRPASRLAEKMEYYIAPEEPERDFLSISRPEDVRICDPACGSGHMLTYAFDLLYAIYEEEGYEAEQIPALILTNNLTGIEIDDRAGALAAFALVMKAAAKLGRRGFLRLQVKPDICVLQNVSFTPAEMQDVAAVVGRDLFTDGLRETLLQFEQAKTFGSLIVPKLRDPTETLRVVAARDFAEDLLLKEVQERVVAVLSMAEALSPTYHVVVANPPYMGGGGMNGNLINWLKDNYASTKSDLFSAFVERLLGIIRPRGFAGIVTPFTWLYISTFKKLRQLVLTRSHVQSFVKPSYTAFYESAIVPLMAIVLREGSASNYKGKYFDLGYLGTGEQQPGFFSTKIKQDDYVLRSASQFLSFDGNEMAYNLPTGLVTHIERRTKLGEICNISEGLKTGENDRFIRFWYEVSLAKTGRFGAGEKWVPHAKGGDFRRWYGNLSWVVNWGQSGSELRATGKAGFQGQPNYGKEGAVWSKISTSYFSVRYQPEGYIFDSACPGFFVKQTLTSRQSVAVLCSIVGQSFIKSLNPTMNFQVGNIAAMPLSDGLSWRDTIENVSSAAIAISKSDWDAYETSIEFSILPLLSPDHRGETLEDSYNRLRTHWRRMTDEMKKLEEENNRIFIDAYGLKGELNPEMPLEGITFTCNPAYRYGGKASEADREIRLRADTVAEFLSYAVGCMFGRYSVDAPGIILANQGERLEDYLVRVPEPSFIPDEDNIIPVLDGDWFPDDITERFRLFLRQTFGEEKFRENLAFIEEALGKDLRRYFTKDFYDDHVKRYKKRPIYWMFSSPKGSFNALIYMHRYRGGTVSILLNDYLREFISKLEGERARLEKLADDASASQAQRTRALKDVAVVVKQIEELNEWEREVVFPLAQAKTEIDLDDGVKANYPKFGVALKKIVGLEATDD
jgi:hypothetical protein